MKAYVIYRSDTGAVARSGTCQECDFAFQAFPGETILEIPSQIDWRKQWRVVGGKVEEVAPPVPTPAELKAKLVARLAERRWQVETSGVTFGAYLIETDDRSKLLVVNAARKAREDSSYSVRWKFGPGQWATLAAADLIAAEDAVFAHVQRCFAREAELAEAIGKAADAALPSFSATVEAFWP